MKNILFAAWCIGYLLVGSIANAQVSSVKDLHKLNRLVDSCFVNIRAHRRPVIGISASQSGQGGSNVPGAYVNAVIKAGGIPVIIPLTDDGSVLRNILVDLDGVIMIGGDDVDPSFYKESPIKQLGEVDSIRDVYDLMLIKMVSDRNIPLLGICRGEQLINVAFGGLLYQDIPTQHPSDIQHKQTEPREKPTHKISVVEGSQLSKIIGAGDFSVNSFHHQAIKQIAPGFKAVAWAPDSIVEGIEATPVRNILAVQWHPEALVANGDTTMLKIFRDLIHEAEFYRKAKDIQERYLSVDTHCDAPSEFKRSGYDMANRESNQVNIPKMQEGKQDAVFMAAYIEQGPRDDASLKKAIVKVNSIIDDIDNEVRKDSDLCGIAYTVDDAIRLKSEGKKAIFIGIENGYAIGKDLGMLAKYKARGVNYMTLCHMKNNDICDTSSRKEKKEWGGLSSFGRKVVKKMNRLGIMIDVSHIGENSFWDVIKLSKQPVIASHSGVKALCNHDRDMTDDQLRALAKNGGVIQVCAVDNYIKEDYKNATIEDFLNHLDHAVKVAGIDHVGMGFDFDGGGGVVGINGANDLINVTMHLLERGYSEQDIAKILGGNLFRVLSQVQAAAKKR